MAHFIDFQVGVENPTDDPDVEVSQYWDSLKSFIDDGEDDAVGRGFYHKLENFNISVDETLEEEYKKSLVDMQNLECSNFGETSEEEGEVDEFKHVEKRVDKFEETILPLPSENENVNSYIVCNKVRS